MIFFKKTYKNFIYILGVLVFTVSTCKVLAQNNITINQYYKAVEHYQTGDYETSMEILQNILKSISKDDTIINISINNLSGILSRNLGNYDDAIFFYTENLKLIKGKSLKKISKTYNNIGNVYKREGRYYKAIEYYNEAVKLILKSDISEKEKNDLLSSEYYNLGIALINTKDYNQASQYFQKSLLIKEEYKFIGIDNIYFNLARIYSKTEQFEQADYYFLEAIKLHEKQYGKNYHRLAPLNMYYGDFLTKQKEFLKAKAYLIKAKILYKQSFKNRHPYTANSYLSFGKYYSAIQKHDSALYWFQQSLIANSKQFNSQDINKNPAINDCFSGLQLLQSLKEKAKALQIIANSTKGNKQIKLYNLSLKTTDIALDLISKLRKDYISIDSKLIITEEEKECYSIGVTASAKLFEVSDRVDYIEKAYRYAAASKASVLKENLEEEKEIHTLVPISERTKKTKLEQKVSAYKRLVYEENEKLNPDSLKINLWESKLFTLNNQYDIFIEGIKTKYHIPEYCIKNSISINEIQEQLPDKTTLIEYFVSKDKDVNNQYLYVFITDKDDFSYFKRELSNVFDNNIDSFKKRMNLFDCNKSDIQSYNQFNKVCYELYSELLDPFISTIKTENIIIVPDEDIAYISFDALISVYKERNNINYADLPFLIYDYCFSYAYSNGFMKHNERNQYSDFVYAFAPEYNDTVNNILRQNFGNLSETKNEIKSVLGFFKGKKYIGNNAVEDSFKTITGQGGILHLAMHASTEEEQKEFSFLAFTENINTPNSEDGFLFSYEIEKMEILSPMVVLSACNTGNGKLYSGEGIFSLSRSFIKAGVPAVVYSLWNVNDAAGSKIMGLFYKKLSEGKTKNVALREAKLDYIKNSSPTFINPVYWSGYVVSGDVSAVKRSSNLLYLIGSGVLILLIGFFVVRKKVV